MIARSEEPPLHQPADLDPLADEAEAPGPALSSVARVLDDWYVACRSKHLRRGELLATSLYGRPLVVYRGEDGRAGALLDRCPHRNVPLSLGRVRGPELECGYHGWRFDARGACQAVPGLPAEGAGCGRGVEAFATREQDGLVWVYGASGVEPRHEPFRFPLLGEPGYTTVYQTVEAQGSLFAVAENALDVPHTAFLHRGLFRGTGQRNRIEVRVTRGHDRAVAEYVGEPPPSGLAARILASGGSGTVVHFDRFVMPCVAQVEYRLGPRTHFCVTTALTPLEDLRTRLFAVLSFRLPLPGWLVALVLAPVARRIFAQDARILASQTENLLRFGGERFASTEADVLGPHILRLLKRAERGARGAPGEAPFERRLELLV